MFKFIVNNISNTFSNSFFCLSLLLFIFPFSVKAQNESAVDSPVIEIPDTLLFKIEKAQAVVTQINTATKKGYNLTEIRQELRSVKVNVDQIKAALAADNTPPDNKSLDNYKLMLNDIRNRTATWRTSLSTTNAELQKLSGFVIDFSRDSLLNVEKNDSTQKRLYFRQIVDLRLKLQEAGKTTTASLDSVSNLLADVSAVYFLANDLQARLNDQLAESGENVLGKETDYIWQAKKSQFTNKAGELVRISYTGQNKILRYFIQSAWDNRILLLLVSIGFFWWVYVNFKLAGRLPLSQTIGPLDFKFIRPVPILASFIVLFNLTPLFEPDSPAIYMELNQFLLLISLSFFLVRRLPNAQIRIWFAVFSLYILVIVSNIIVEESLFSRALLILLNIGSICFGIWFYRKLKQASLDEKFIRPILIIYIVLNSLAVLLNIFGRVSLAKSFNITAISSLIQIISLAVFIHIIAEAMELQIKVSSCSGGLFSRININRSRASFRKLLTILSVVLWLLMFFINLNVLDFIFGLIGQVLQRERTFGSITFTLGNILFFSVIIWISNKLQKNIGFFFGESDITFTSTETVQKGSQMALTRLIIIVVGFLFAVTASGVPLDKVTVLLGALGVGIGLGMQNIVNNFVSGIILIFEKPFHIGDYIELADKKGKVLDIGIRSSRMLTPQGSRVIIPNGDLLSGRLVNYTSNNSHLKSEVVFKVNMDTDMDVTKKIINEIIDGAEGIVKNAPRQILFNAVTVDSIELKIIVWVTSVYDEAAFKSYVFEQLISRLRSGGIKIM